MPVDAGTGEDDEPCAELLCAPVLKRLLQVKDLLADVLEVVGLKSPNPNASSSNSSVKSSSPWEAEFPRWRGLVALSKMVRTSSL